MALGESLVAGVEHHVSSENELYQAARNVFPLIVQAHLCQRGCALPLPIGRTTTHKQTWAAVGDRSDMARSGVQLEAPEHLARNNAHRQRRNAARRARPIRRHAEWNVMCSTCGH